MKPGDFFDGRYEMKQIPVLIGFDSSKPIGFLTIDESELPPGVGYVFALGYMIEQLTEEKVEAEVVCVSLLTDEQYYQYATRLHENKIANPDCKRCQLGVDLCFQHPLRGL